MWGCCLGHLHPTSQYLDWSPGFTQIPACCHCRLEARDGLCSWVFATPVADLDSAPRPGWASGESTVMWTSFPATLSSEKSNWPIQHVYSRKRHRYEQIHRCVGPCPRGFCEVSAAIWFITFTFWKGLSLSSLSSWFPYLPISVFLWASLKMSRTNSRLVLGVSQEHLHRRPSVSGDIRAFLQGPSLKPRGGRAERS